MARFNVFSKSDNTIQLLIIKHNLKRDKTDETEKHPTIVSHVLNSHLHGIAFQFSKYSNEIVHYVHRLELAYSTKDFPEKS